MLSTLEVVVVETMIKYFVEVIGVLVFGGRCGGRRSSDSEGSEDAADPVGRQRKRRRVKSLEIKSAY